MKLTPTQRLILETLDSRSDRGFTTARIAQLAEISTAAAYRPMRRLRELGLVTVVFRAHAQDEYAITTLGSRALRL